MIKENLKLKEKLTYSEMADFTNALVDSCFVEDVSGEIQYVPYYYEPTFKVLFFMVCIDGLSFDDNDSILDLSESDDELKTFWEKPSLNKLNSSDSIYDQLTSIRENADKMIEFKIQQIVHRSPWELLVRTLVDKINSSDLNLDNIADAIVSAYLKSDVFKENRAEVERARQGNAKSHEKFKEELKQLTKDKIKK